MADSSAATGLTVKQWDAKFFTEYVQANRFAKYFGTNENSIIQVKEDLTKKKGDAIHFALVNRLSGAGVTGSSTLEGNEESMESRSHQLTVNKIRNAVRVSDMEEQKSAIPLRNAARSVLKTWAMETCRDDIIEALHSINGTVYASANATARNAWLVDNADRCLFGDAIGNGGYSVHATDLATVTAGMTMSGDIVSLARRIALTASPKVRPVTIDGDEQWYVMFVNPQQFRDLKVDLKTENTDGRARGRDNPIFTGESILWDGVIVREIADMSGLAEASGATSASIAPAFLVGAQAVGIGWAKRTRSVTEQFDYEDKYGVAIEEIRGIEKLTFGSGSGDTDDLKDNGVVTVWTGSAADA